MDERMRYPAGSPFPPIAEYAFPSDRNVNALVHLIREEHKRRRGLSTSNRLVA